MLKSSKHLSDLAKESNMLLHLNETESARLKSCLLEIFDDVMEVCKRNQLTIMVAGGTALGAVRHKGFIPWDDDLDVIMPREDYDRLLDLFEQELSWGYYLHAPNTKQGATNVFAKIMKKNTMMIDLYNNKNDNKKGISIDIFPIENVPDNYLMRQIKLMASDLLRYMVVSTFMFQNRNKIIKEYFSADFKSLINYQIRLFIGMAFSFFSYNRWYNLYDFFVRHNRQSKYVATPSGRMNCNGGVYKRETLLPPSKGVFENREVPLPHNPHEYLKKAYGDYMQIPPPEKRERHYFVKIDFDKEMESI